MDIENIILNNNRKHYNKHIQKTAKFLLKNNRYNNVYQWINIVSFLDNSNIDIDSIYLKKIINNDISEKNISNIINSLQKLKLPINSYIDNKCFNKLPYNCVIILFKTYKHRIKNLVTTHFKYYNKGDKLEYSKQLIDILDIKYSNIDYIVNIILEYLYKIDSDLRFNIYFDIFNSILPSSPNKEHMKAIKTIYTLNSIKDILDNIDIENNLNIFNEISIIIYMLISNIDNKGYYKEINKYYSYLYKRNSKFSILFKDILTLQRDIAYNKFHYLKNIDVNKIPINREYEINHNDVLYFNTLKIIKKGNIISFNNALQYKIMFNIISENNKTILEKINNLL